MLAASVAVIVVAAGSGTRLGYAEPKAFVPLAGRAILAHALESVLGMAESCAVVVVAPSDRTEQALAIVEETAGAASDRFRVIAGGPSRQASVAAGLAALPASVEIVLVHDSARPFTPSAVFDVVVARVRATGTGQIPGLPVADTLKRTEDDIAVETVDRSLLTAVQTPQGFPRSALESAYRDAVAEYTDDAALFSAAGHPVTVLPGDARSYKITTPEDFHRAALSLGDAAPQPSASRTGIGIDVHAYDAGMPLWLGGLYWPGEAGLAGHSDGDAVAHALCDALLSAAGLGDVGERFGTSDPRFAGAHGEVFVRATADLVRGAGYSIANVAVQVVGERPRMAARRAEVEEALSGFLGAPVSVSATTTDGLGFPGRGEGLMAIATALVTRPTPNG